MTSSEEATALLEEKNRLLILSALAAAQGTIEFTVLMDKLALSRGNLSTHLKRLEEGGLVSVRKEFVDRKPRSTYSCTPQGRAALGEYLRHVEKLIRGALGRG